MVAEILTILEAIVDISGLFVTLSLGYQASMVSLSMWEDD
jgi:hypothetical protein